jgi:copper oxidase (laccase) domain-containing protein
LAYWVGQNALSVIHDYEQCLPMFASNQSGTQIGVAHAGWQGILNGVIESFIEQFDERDLLIHFGAAISSKNRATPISVPD